MEEGSSSIAFLLIAFLSMNYFSSALVIRVSQRNGSDSTSCLMPYSSQPRTPCRTLWYAVRALEEDKNENETVFSFSIEDQVYFLDKRINVSQTNRKRRVYFKAGTSGSRVIIRCQEDSDSSGIEIGARDPKRPKTRNVFFQNLGFQSCGPLFAAVVLIWNSVYVNFKNCEFKQNRQAGINAFNSGVAIENCSFIENTSPSTYNANFATEAYVQGINSTGGGAGFVYHNAENLSLIIKNSIFKSNVAVTDETRNYIAPSFNVSDFPTAGGGMIVLFLGVAKYCQVLIENTVFVNNKATNGGGLYFAVANMAKGHNLTVINSNFSRNYASQTGGGLGLSQWDNSSNLNILVKNCLVNKNIAKQGGGINVFLMSFNMRNTDSTLRLDSVTFSYNYAKTVILFSTALPRGMKVDITPELINCSIKNSHLKRKEGRLGSLTSQRVNLKFTGDNVFHKNEIAAAAAFMYCVIFVHGRLAFTNNTGNSTGGALLIVASQIILFPDTELLFLGNHVSGLGGAVCVFLYMADLTHANNPDCFLAYSDPFLPPSKWKTNVSFIENSSTIKGTAIYISSLQSCSWNEEVPHYNPDKALRWSSNFIYQNNRLILDNGAKVLSDSKYDIATDTKRIQPANGVHTSMKLSAGETTPLNLQAIDELGNEVVTAVRAFANPEKAFIQSNFLFLSPNKTSAFMFKQPKESYEKTKENDLKHTFRLLVTDLWSFFANEYHIKVETEVCHPGFVYSMDDQTCVCDESEKAIQRCSEDGRTVHLKEGYWANATNGGFVSYFCPVGYCKCEHERGFSGCLFDPERTDRQCAENREGWLCGKCVANTSVGLRGRECIRCDNSGWILGFLIVIVFAFYVVVIWLNLGISIDLRGPLFFFQVLPQILYSTSPYARVLANIFTIEAPFSYLPNTCIVKGLNSLQAIAFIYMIPLLALLVCLLAYFLNRRLKFKFRRRSMLHPFWLILVLVYSYLMETSFFLLFCPKVGDKHVFFFDGTVDCFRGDHLPLAIIALLILVFMVLPPPIIVVLLTVGIWKVNTQYTSTLTGSLRPECRWWWSVEFIRRVLVVSIYALIPNWEVKKIVFAFVFLVFLTVHTNFQPYENRRANIMESLYLMVLCILAFMQSYEDKTVKDYICCSLVILAALHTLAVLLCKAAGLFRRRLNCCTTCVRESDLDRIVEEIENTPTNSPVFTHGDFERQQSIQDSLRARSLASSSDNSSFFTTD
ncbi:uncharacterized protein LOC141866153 [Acropora palmata]|uniref:uncharacterized protein LOC141866153 n=1 Tax=Acropora palmata TaxID=6131 RepID=UPI003DA0086C